MGNARGASLSKVGWRSLHVQKKERKEATEENDASEVKTDPGSEDEPPVVRSLAGQIGQEGIGGFHKGKGKGKAGVSGGSSERNMYHATLYRRYLSGRYEFYCFIKRVEGMFWD